jgi:predicted transcriptional regulator
MGSNTLKDLLIQRIQAINDETFLQALKILTDAKVEQDGYILNQFEKEKINKARAQYAKGETFTQDEVKEDIDRWLENA